MYLYYCAVIRRYSRILPGLQVGDREDLRLKAGQLVMTKLEVVKVPRQLGLVTL